MMAENTYKYKASCDKWHKLNSKTYRFRINVKKDDYIVDWLDNISNISGYVRSLIAQDIEKHSNNGK